LLLANGLGIKLKCAGIVGEQVIIWKELVFDLIPAFVLFCLFKKSYLCSTIFARACVYP
jgi:hypothetical protein